MRTNLPVTGNRYDFPADQTLVSITDLKGRITYCNANFIEVSGYTREELIGQPHNLVRHPDMPEEAFRDMWETIQRGMPWTAIIKNRRKNGDYYWVRANATPVRGQGGIAGYLSVRSHVSDEEIEAAEHLYAAMRVAAGHGRPRYALRRGVVIDNSVIGRLRRLCTLDLRRRFALRAAVAAGAPVAAAAAGLDIWSMLAAGACAAMLVTFDLVRIGIRPLRTVVDTANLLASGDLTSTVHVTGKAEIGQLQIALAQLAMSVRTVTGDIQAEVVNLRRGAREISEGNHAMSGRVESQASSLEQTAAAMEEINGAVQQTAGLAGEGASVAREASQVAQRSHEAVQGVVATMHEIAEASQRIGDIIKVIEGVAFQTNILALNAAVEAARAGEQGKGFAVVASEVRALAQRTAQASKEIRALIEESGERVAMGGQRADEARARMDEVVESVGRVTASLEHINNACDQQSTGISQVNVAIAQLDDITQRNAAMVEQLAAAAGSLDAQMSTVHDTVRVFRLSARDVTLAEADAVALRRQMRVEAAAGPVALEWSATA